MGFVTGDAFVGWLCAFFETGDASVGWLSVFFVTGDASVERKVAEMGCCGPTVVPTVA